jgi:isopentenyldiphosphate isomerase
MAVKNLLYHSNPRHQHKQNQQYNDWIIASICGALISSSVSPLFTFMEVEAWWMIGHDNNLCYQHHRPYRLYGKQSRVLSSLSHKFPVLTLAALNPSTFHKESSSDDFRNIVGHRKSIVGMMESNNEHDPLESNTKEQLQNSVNPSSTTTSSTSYFVQYSLAGPFLVLMKDYNYYDTSTLSPYHYNWYAIPVQVLYNYIPNQLNRSNASSLGDSFSSESDNRIDNGSISWNLIHYIENNGINFILNYMDECNIDDAMNFSVQMKVETAIDTQKQVSLTISCISPTVYIESEDKFKEDLIQILMRMIGQWSILRFMDINQRFNHGLLSLPIELTFVYHDMKCHDKSIRFDTVSQFLLQSSSKDEENEENDIIPILFPSFQQQCSSLLKRSKIEIIEMVDTKGRTIGYLPRTLVHQYNILHRGIGIFVTKDRPLQILLCEGHAMQQPDLYVHQRSHDKRIFPSLYDMFVGGISLAKEPSIVTAQREIAEELGLLGRTESILGPILQCLICTSYNRCVVHLYSYAMDTTVESIKLQEEEVQWGSFVSYDVINDEAQLSIERLRNSGKWPGTCTSVHLNHMVNDYNVRNVRNWDFVPDGLLVWESWLNHLKRLELILVDSAADEKK